MKQKFFIRLAIHAVTLPLLFILIYRVAFVGHQWVRTKNDPTALYVIGDSRVVHGLDIVTLEEKLGVPVHNYATHGMSAYNMYVVAEVLPPKATVLLAPSLGMFIREREFMSFESGLSIPGMHSMFELGYEWWYFEKILASNRYPFGLGHYRFNREAFPITDGPDLEKTERFRRIYENMKSPPPWFARNEVLFGQAIEILLAKGCDVRIVEFPVTKELHAMRAESVFANLTDEIEVLTDPRLKVWTNVEIADPEGRNIYYDMDHLNERGRGLMTAWLYENVLRPR